MITAAEFSAAALSFPSAIDAPHFKRIAFKVDVKGGKTFATFASANKLTLLSALRHAWLNAAPAKYHEELEAK